MKRPAPHWLVSALAPALIGCPRPEADPDLDVVPQLLAARRFDEVERRLDAQVRLHPEDDRAHVLAAQVALARPGPRPARALELLRKVRLRDPKSLALVRLNEGKAHSNLLDDDAAERAWLDALRLDPQVPEAGWALLGLYYVQGRADEARRLALRLSANEPDPRDRAQLLLELVRQDAMPLEPGSVAEALRSRAAAHPESLPTVLALGRALVRGSRAGEGLALLREAVKRRPDSPEAWDALLGGLDDAGAYDEQAATLARLPAAIAALPRFARHEGRAAQERHDWAAAAAAYRRAFDAGAGGPELVYRLGRALRLARRPDEAERFERLALALDTARNASLDLYKEANARRDLGAPGKAANLGLYHRLADLREALGRRDEALAWHRLALRDRPDEPVSLAAVARLGAGQ